MSIRWLVSSALLWSCAGMANAEQNRSMHRFVSVTPAFQSEAEFDDGGEFRMSSGLLRAGVTFLNERGQAAGLTFAYDYFDYEDAPWTAVQRFGLHAPLMRRSGSWTYLLSPSVEIAKEDGAQTSESLTYGGTMAFVRHLDPQRQIGFGLNLSAGLEKVRVLPVVIVDWALTDRLRLVNPPAASPGGGGGIQLDYKLTSWTVGAGGTFRRLRFRLSEDNPALDGIGEQRSGFLYVHARRDLAANLNIDFFAGTAIGGRLALEDSSGNDLSEVDYDPAALAGVMISARF